MLREGAELHPVRNRAEEPISADQETRARVRAAILALLVLGSATGVLR
jgi:hypothetical protein